MSDIEMKKRVAQEIMDLMDQEDGKRLKNHPKLKPAPKLPPKPESPVEGVPAIEDDELESDLDSAPVEAAEGAEGEDPELTPEMIQKLIEMMDGE